MILVYVSFAEYRLFYRALLQKRPRDVYRVYYTCCGVAMISTLLQITGLFCRVSFLLLVLGSFAKETYNVKEPPNRSRPIVYNVHMSVYTN